MQTRKKTTFTSESWETLQCSDRNYYSPCYICQKGIIKNATVKKQVGQCIELVPVRLQDTAISSSSLKRY